MTPLRTVAALLVLVFAFSASPVAASAVEPDEIAEQVFTQGFYVEEGASITDAEASAIVSSARNEGSRYHLIVLVETPPGGNTAFADAVYDRMGIDSGTVFVLSEDDTGWVSVDEFTEAELEEAFIIASDAGGSDAAYAANFTAALFGLDLNVGSTGGSGSADTGSAAGGSDDGGGGSGFLWFILIVGGLGLLVWWLIRRNKAQASKVTESQLAKARSEIQVQLDGIANDILDMEVEVRGANNATVDALFDEASTTYSEASDELAAADTPQKLLDLSNKVDLAVWQLDSCEAILDGKQAPPKPEPQKLAPPPQPEPSQRAPGGGSAGSSLPPRPSYPQYQRRSSRRSSGLSPGMLDVLIGLGAGAMMGRRRGSSRSGWSRSSSRSTGGVIPGPSTRRSRSRRSSSSSRSRGTGRRVRGGGKRRR
jgi:hypothetical protein